MQGGGIESHLSSRTSPPLHAHTLWEGPPEGGKRAGTASGEQRGPPARTVCLFTTELIHCGPAM